MLLFSNEHSIGLTIVGLAMHQDFTAMAKRLLPRGLFFGNDSHALALAVTSGALEGAYAAGFERAVDSLRSMGMHDSAIMLAASVPHSGDAQ